MNIISPEVFQKLMHLQKCVVSHCNKEQANLLAKAKIFSQDLQKIMENQDMSPIAKAKKIQEVTMKIYKTTERLKFTECQIKNCKEETKDAIKAIIHIYENSPEELKSHKVVKAFFKKYSKILEKDFTAKELIQYDIDSLKFKKVIAEFEEKLLQIQQVRQDKKQDKPVKKHHKHKKQ
jgi:tRNA G37 N-methylase Trm5